MKVIVYHDSYGCETGCCGHRIELEDGRKASPMQAALGLETLYMPHHATCPQGKEWRR